jgi:hypothetical protein
LDGTYQAVGRFVHRELIGECLDRLFACPGDFKITLEKRGDRVEIYAGTKRDWIPTLKEVAEVLGCSVETARVKYVKTKRLIRYPRGFRRADVEGLK